MVEYKNHLEKIFFDNPDKVGEELSKDIEIALLKTQKDVFNSEIYKCKIIIKLLKNDDPHAHDALEAYKLRITSHRVSIKEIDEEISKLNLKSK